MKDDDHYNDDEAERRARAAIERSFQTPHKPQKEMIGKSGQTTRRKRVPSEVPKKSE
jgi:hypothetical protein